MKKYKLVRTPKQSPGLYLKATKAWWVSVPAPTAMWSSTPPTELPARAVIGGPNSAFGSPMAGFTESGIGHALGPRGQGGLPGAVPDRQSHGNAEVDSVPSIHGPLDHPRSALAPSLARS